MILPFTKMHGLGNDFVVINALEQTIQLQAEQFRLLADRRFGIGCDQILMIEPSDSPGIDVRYRIFNADGSEVEQCGNGVRCIAEYMRRRKLLQGDSLRVETSSGEVTVYLQDDEQIRVDMGLPSLQPADIPLATAQYQLYYTLALAGGEQRVMAVSMGNPHAIVEVDNIDVAAVALLGPEIQQQALFPAGVNVGFMQILDRSHIRLRVYERGVGETLACGTGACGAVVAGINAGRLANEVIVALAGGNLTISWAGEGEVVWMSGPASTVFEGQIEI